MSIALLLISDGREAYLDRTLASIEDNVPTVEHFVHVDDSTHELGFAGAIQDGWRRVLETGAEFCFHVEQDFTFNRPVPLDRMRSVLAHQPHLVQIALLRQPWNAKERKAGGIVQADPGDYEMVQSSDLVWLEHMRCFTTNPSLIPRWVLERGWPQRDQSEGHFGIDLFASDPSLRAAYWGDGQEWVTHIGDERHGHGY